MLNGKPTLTPWEQAQQSANYIRMRWVTNGSLPEICLVAGSGINGITDQMVVKCDIPYNQIPHFPCGKIDGHDEKLVIGTLFGVPIMVLVGRVHLYQGFTPVQVAHHVATMAAIECKAAIITNASGCVKDDWEPGRVMIVQDHIGFTQGSNCLIGPLDGREEQFPDPNNAYDDALSALFAQAFMDLGISCHKGTFAGLFGPAYETRAETVALQVMGAGAAGMSMVQEVLMLHARGVRIAALSVMVNRAGGGPSKVRMHHSDVVSVAEEVTKRQVLPALRIVLRQMAEQLGISLCAPPKPKKGKRDTK